jgi:IclR family KDG regulon transcriptional repressor
MTRSPIALVSDAPGKPIRSRSRAGEEPCWSRPWRSSPAGTDALQVHGPDQVELPGRTRRRHPAYVIAPIEKAARVFRYIASSAKPLTLKEICGVLGLPKTTVFRYLRTLEHCGFVTHDREHDLYQLDVALWALVDSSLALQRLRRAAVPYLEALRDELGDTVNLGVIDGADVVYLEIVKAPGSIHTFTRVGGRDPLYATALGKAILAHLPGPVREAALPQRLRKMTARTLSSRASLERELAEVRVRRFAVERAENEDGAACVGVPIFDSSGEVMAALSLTTASEKLPAVRIDSAAIALGRSALALSRVSAVGAYSALGVS